MSLLRKSQYLFRDYAPLLVWQNKIAVSVQFNAGIEGYRRNTIIPLINLSLQ